jgi:hypothetical protein
LPVPRRSRRCRSSFVRKRLATRTICHSDYRGRSNVGGIDRDLLRLESGVCSR